MTENYKLPKTFQMQHILKNKKSVIAVAWLSTALVIVVGGLVRGREDLAHSMTNAIAYCVIMAAVSLIYVSKLGARKKIFAGTLFIIGCLGALNLLAGNFLFGLAFIPYVALGLLLFKQQSPEFR